MSAEQTIHSSQSPNFFWNKNAWHRLWHVFPSFSLASSFGLACAVTALLLVGIGGSPIALALSICAAAFIGFVGAAVPLGFDADIMQLRFADKIDELREINQAEVSAEAKIIGRYLKLLPEILTSSMLRQFMPHTSLARIGFSLALGFTAITLLGVFLGVGGSLAAGVFASSPVAASIAANIAIAVGITAGLGLVMRFLQALVYPETANVKTISNHSNPYSATIKAMGKTDTVISAEVKPILNSAGWVHSTSTDNGDFDISFVTREAGFRKRISLPCAGLSKRQKSD